MRSHFLLSTFYSLLSTLFLFSAVFAQDQAILPVSPSQKEPVGHDLVQRSWAASGGGDLQKLEEIVGQCVALYGKEAKEQEKQLTGFPQRGQEEQYRALNSVATCLFVKAEALMNAGKTEDAVVRFQEIIDEYPWAQAWDPRGWYWSIAEKSQASINVLTGKVEEEPEVQPEKLVRTKPYIHTRGRSRVVDYQKYGEFQKEGTQDYIYVVKDMEGLLAAVGEGIYPNSGAIFQNPRYKEVRKEGRLKGKHWDFVNSDDLEAAYFKWATAPESWGVRLFYLGSIFEKAEMYDEALRAYRALVVHFPKTVAWTYWQTPWYPGQAAIAKIRHILRIHPELDLAEKYMKITVHNGFDNDAQNDVIVTWPGIIIVPSSTAKSASRPLKRMRAKAKPAIAEERPVPIAESTAILVLLYRYMPIGSSRNNSL